jgi:type IV fimbrial biogenesis protein FimT
MPLSDLNRTTPKPIIGARGVSLLEALVVMALLGILAAIGAPALSDLRARHQLQGAAEGLLESLVLARSEALRRQQRVTLCAQATSQTCDAQGQWQQGWLVFVDANNTGQREPEEVVLQVHDPVLPPMRLRANLTLKGYFSYGADGRSQSTGGSFMSGTWRFCHDAWPVGWKVVSNALGRPRVEKSTPQDCP